MKRSALFATLLAASTLYAGDDFEITISGFSDFQVGITSQDDAYEAGKYDRSTYFQNDTELHFNVHGKAANGITYGAIIELEADISSADDNEGLNADKTYLYGQHDRLGRLELGGTSGASDLLKVDASKLAVATGGISGKWKDYVDTNGLTGASAFIIRPDLPTAHALGNAEDANKISYYSPRISGAQVGVSYVPDVDVAGTATAFDASGVDYEDVIELGLNYKGQTANELTYAASITGQFGQDRDGTREDLSAYALGLELGYRTFSLAASYGDWGDSGLGVGIDGDQSYYSVGAAYKNGPVGASITYLDSEVEQGGSSIEHQNLVLGAEYTVLPGLTPYAEVAFFDLDEAGDTDNDGAVVLLGTQLNF